MTTHPFTHPDDAIEDLAEGGTWLLDLVAAVDHLRRGHRPGLTVWEAIAEAMRDSERTDRPPADLVHDLQSAGSPTAAGQVQAAVRRWVTVMADRYNNGHHWPHPLSRRGFPPPMLAFDDDTGGRPAS
ncbi:MAG: hypothetical protein AB7H92_03780 [Microbacteriaceae bacterium]